MTRLTPDIWRLFQEHTFSSLKRLHIDNSLNITFKSEEEFEKSMGNLVCRTSIASAHVYGRRSSRFPRQSSLNTNAPAEIEYNGELQNVLLFESQGSRFKVFGLISDDLRDVESEVDYEDDDDETGNDGDSRVDDSDSGMSAGRFSYRLNGSPGSYFARPSGRRSSNPQFIIVGTDAIT